MKSVVIVYDVRKGIGRKEGKEPHVSRVNNVYLAFTEAYAVLSLGLII